MVVGRRHGSVVKGLEILVGGRRRLGWLLLTGGLRITSSVSIVLQLAWHGVTVTRTVICKQVENYQAMLWLSRIKVKCAKIFLAAVVFWQKAICCSNQHST